MKAFVTGGTGFIGSHLVEALQVAGHEPVCLVRNPAKAAALFGNAPPRTVPGDLRDPAALKRGCRGCDVVFHVAGMTAGKTRDELFQVNRDLTQALVAAATAAGTVTRFVYVSSLAGAGPSPRGRPRTEADAPAPVSQYGASKLAGETVVGEAELPSTIVRPPTVYGPRDTEIFRMLKIVRWHLAPLVVPADQELSFVYVTDLARALVAAGTGAETTGVYFAAHPEIVTARSFVCAVHEALHGTGSAGPVIIPLPQWLTRAAMGVTYLGARLVGRRTLLSPDKAKEFRQVAWTCASDALPRDTGWHAEVGLELGLRLAVEWYREAGWL